MNPVKREMVLEYLNRHPSSTRDEIIRGLELSEDGNIRRFMGQELGRLVKQGLVAEQDERFSSLEVIDMPAGQAWEGIKVHAYFPEWKFDHVTAIEVHQRGVAMPFPPLSNYDFMFVRDGEMPEKQDPTWVTYPAGSAVNVHYLEDGVEECESLTIPNGYVLIIASRP